jgi:hypothetical protein
MAETTIGALSNLATAIATDRGVVATLTEANSRLAKHIEDRSNELKDIKALLKKERAEIKGQRTSNTSPEIIINVFYFNCAFSKLIWTNLCKQSVSHNTPLIELGHVLVTLFLS